MKDHLSLFISWVKHNYFNISNFRLVFVILLLLDVSECRVKWHDRWNVWSQWVTHVCVRACWELYLVSQCVLLFRWKSLEHMCGNNVFVWLGNDRGMYSYKLLAIVSDLCDGRNSLVSGCSYSCGFQVVSSNDIWISFENKFYTRMKL